MTVLADGGTKIRLPAHRICSVVNNLTPLSKFLDLWGGKALYKHLYLLTGNFYAGRKASVITCVTCLQHYALFRLM
jgi:hypothetical protein